MDGRVGGGIELGLRRSAAPSGRAGEAQRGGVAGRAPGMRGILDHPHYTRPAEVDAHGVPDVLLSGHHAEIRHWRKREAVRRTLERRPDLLEHAVLDDEERAILRELKDEGKGH